MKLRKQEVKDAPLMLEWMHDEDVVRSMRRDFSSMTVEDCLNFIDKSQFASEDLHMAVTDDNDEYMGTVSLKHIRDGRAEFGITVRSCAMGKGISASAMKSILDIGFHDLDLDEIYWCVDPGNIRALRFYDKNGYERTDAPECIEDYSPEEISHYVWYSIQKSKLR